MDYITIDFETANQNFTSACSIGIVGVKNNKIVLEEYYLINPQEDFSEYHSNIHQIKFEDVSGADTFDIVWNNIEKYFKNSIVFAHNANFDMMVLKSVIEKYKLNPPVIKFGCTWKIASKLWKDELQNHKLNTLSQYLELEHLHHNALSDAKVCAEIIIRGQRVMNVSEVNELYEALGIRYGLYDERRFVSSLNKYTRNRKNKVIKNDKLNDKVVFLSGKPNSLSRRQLIDKLLSNGVYIEKNINRSLDYFILMNNCPKINLALVHDLILKNVPIKILTEIEILNMVV